MESQGYQMIKLKPEDVYIPPPPRWGWVKAGVSEGKAGNAAVDCEKKIMSENKDTIPELNKCMEAQGFKWEVIDPHPKNAY